MPRPYEIEILAGALAQDIVHICGWVMAFFEALLDFCTRHWEPLKDTIKAYHRRRVWVNLAVVFVSALSLGLLLYLVVLRAPSAVPVMRTSERQSFVEACDRQFVDDQRRWEARMEL
ncbi:hypothetical protein DPSP01_012619 [Paraphaeosphaeria sporulosa]|uniref:Transmembrane protein n=1 Tax=Paraphaeosphaeria sporulosa TaxID=1460663 RepID=A0A177CW41_9PLEO|nr:uncharacterized protein CC84DRAFT_1214360 [Paraphaeosphaeria sporulosa]OAG11112.1 hypothetical protein CC84DRAFT_1214360 [Paraphaeosphaeria sporulosa]